MKRNSNIRNQFVENKFSHKSKILGCSGCCIFPFPLFWYSKTFSNEGEENNDGSTTTRRNLQEGDDDYIPPIQEIDKSQ